MLFRFTTPARLCTAAATRPVAGLITLCQGGDSNYLIIFTLKLDVIKTICVQFPEAPSDALCGGGSAGLQDLQTGSQYSGEQSALYLVNPAHHFLLHKVMLIRYYWQDELINHLKIHAGSRTVKGSVDKKFSCNQCDKKFFTRKDLKRHR